jgi:hypothetical protein
VRFVARLTSPSVEGVIESHARFKLLEIVRIHARQCERGGEQPRGLWREIEAGRVSAANEGGKAHQGRGCESELLDHDLESAFIAAMAPVDALNVEGRCAEALRDVKDFARRDEEEHCGRVDKAADQPRTRNAIDLGPFPPNPDCAPLGVTRRQSAFGHERQACSRPGGVAADKNLGGGCAGVTQPGGNALA